MNLTQLNKLARDFNLNPDKISFYGEHDVVYLDIDETSIPNIDDSETDAFYNEYGLHRIEGYWGFYT